MWESYKKGFKAYLQLEKSLSDNSVEAYLRDIEKLTEYFQQSNNLKTPAEVQLKDLEKFLKWIAGIGSECYFAGKDHFGYPGIL